MATSSKDCENITQSTDTRVRGPYKSYLVDSRNKIPRTTLWRRKRARFALLSLYSEAHNKCGWAALLYNNNNNNNNTVVNIIEYIHACRLENSYANNDDNGECDEDFTVPVSDEEITVDFVAGTDVTDNCLTDHSDEAPNHDDSSNHGEEAYDSSPEYIDEDIDK